MIAKSDLIILTLATAALTVGVVRWQYNIRPSEAITVPASVRLSPPETASSQQPLRAPAVTSGQAWAPPTQASTPTRTTGPETEAVASQSRTERATTVPAVNAEDAEPKLGIHVVTSGEYLSLIARKYDTTVNELTALNDIEGDIIYVGQELRYPQTN